MRNLAIVMILALMMVVPVADAAPDAGKTAAAASQPSATASQPAAAPKAAEPKKVADTAAGEPTMPDSVPTDASGAIDAGKKVIEDAKAKKWFAMAAGIIGLLMFGFKTARKKIDAMARIPKRVLWIVVPVLSVAMMLLAKFQDDLSWAAASQVLFSGPSVAFLNDLIKRGVMGKEPSPMKPNVS